MKIVNIEGENYLNDLRNFDDIFRKGVAYNNIKSHKKQSVTLSLENTFSEKQQAGRGGGGGDYQIDTPSLFRVNKDNFFYVF